MNLSDAFKELLNTFSQEGRYKNREMKRVFQLRRYLEWKELTYQERLAAKRLLFVPVAAYFLFAFINQYAFTIVFLICLYLLYKKLEKGKLKKRN